MRYTYYGRFTDLIPKTKKAVDFMLEEFNLQNIDAQLRRYNSSIDVLSRAKREIQEDIIAIKNTLKEIKIKLVEIAHSKDKTFTAKKICKKDEEKETIKRNLKKKGYKVD
jgi:hypothetical protein